MPLPDALRLIDECAEMGVGEFLLTGGELTYPDLLGGVCRQNERKSREILKAAQAKRSRSLGAGPNPLLLPVLRSEAARWRTGGRPNLFRTPRSRRRTRPAP